jgi:hypothetical protein
MPQLSSNIYQELTNNDIAAFMKSSFSQRWNFYASIIISIVIHYSHQNQVEKAQNGR